MTVLDASAILALVHEEPGADLVAARLEGALLGAANLAEVIGKLVDADIDVRRPVGGAPHRPDRSRPREAGWRACCAGRTPRPGRSAAGAGGHDKTSGEKARTSWWSPPSAKAVSSLMRHRWTAPGF